jgi:hypothetical protein
VDDRGPDRPPYGTALALGSWAWDKRRVIYGRVALAGGNPDRLSLRHFLDAALVLLVDEYLAHGTGRVPITLALNAAEELLEAAANESQNGTPMPTPSSSVPVASDNDRALADLMAQIGGVKLG